MAKEYRQIEWDEQLAGDCRQLVRLAVREDLDRVYDWTTVSRVSEAAQGRAMITARSEGVVAGLQTVPVLLDECDRAWNSRRASPAAAPSRTFRSNRDG